MRILLDTNIFISALWVRGTPPALLLDRWRAGTFSLVSSEVQFAELAGVLDRPKIRQRIAHEEATRLLADLRREVIWATNLPSVDLSPDVADNLIIATAIAGQAEMIVSGDRAGMLDLKEVGGIAIVTARQALAVLRGDE